MKSSWIYIGASVTGKSHLEKTPPIPCQDAHAYKKLSDSWGISVVCDGAGSASNSHIGSSYVSEKAITVFEKIAQKNLFSKSKLPSKKSWEKLAFDGFLEVRDSLKSYSIENNLGFRDLACTISVVIHSPKGLLVTHIGDGRGAYLNAKYEWVALFRPHETEQDNITIFITSDQWLQKGYEMSNVTVPESLIIEGQVLAYALLTDGMEFHSFDLGRYDNDDQLFYPENKPFIGFFKNVHNTLLSMVEGGLTEKEMRERWATFLQSGTKSISDESDDKTMLFVINQDMR